MNQTDIESLAIQQAKAQMAYGALVFEKYECWFNDSIVDEIHYELNHDNFTLTELYDLQYGEGGILNWKEPVQKTMEVNIDKIVVKDNDDYICLDFYTLTIFKPEELFRDKNTVYWIGCMVLEKSNFCLFEVETSKNLLVDYS